MRIELFNVAFRARGAHNFIQDVPLAQISSLGGVHTDVAWLQEIDNVQLCG